MILVAAMLAAVPARGAGPRWTTGWPYYQNNGGSPVVWYTTQPQYFTDPGDLSASVNHAAADALVAAAAATWNNSMSSLTLTQGGALNEHVSGANVYVGSSGPVFPSDVQASNYAAIQIAVIYDSDGSVTDTLLGGGASDPSNCRQSAVTESVDSIATNGTIQHALIVLNGRCTGSAAALQQEMKYRLIRAFGRVLGLGWSQLNDNVFTGSPQPTSQQAQNWPIMHPIDLLCGPYAYQCILQPFTLRTDDIASLVSMYPVTSAGNGKTLTYSNAAKVWGYVSFPNGQPMEGLLVSLRRFHFGPGYTDAFDLTSSVTGYSFQQTGGNPITPKTYAQADSNGSSNPYVEGYYSLGWVPVPTTDYFDNMTVTTSAINPLYTGQYAVGPYAASQVTPSGPSMTNTAYVVNTQFGAELDMTSTGAPATCGSGSDGTESSPLAASTSGSWSDTLCGYQHTAWSSLAVQAGRSLTMEVTAVDEQGYATTGKMLPVLGAWDSGDPYGQPPTLASQAVALNASTLGMTNLRVSTSTARTMRIAVADQRGDGRPDYGYNARILYADSVSPASLPANGGVVTISGMGFHPGNTVTVNGIAATVTNWTATAITLVAPAITGPLAADVVVSDLSTGGQTTMSGALTYSQTAQPDVLSVMAKPANGGYVGSVGSPSFKVQVLLPDGATLAVGVAVTLTSSSATFGACSGASTCVLTTDSSGMVRSPVTPTSAGSVTLTATVGSASVSASFVALAIPVDGLSVVSMPSGTVYATLPAATPFGVKVTLPDGTTAAAGVSVVVTATNAGLGGCSGAASCTLVADSSGMISTTVTPAAAGVVSLLATAGGGTVSASFGATALPADVLHVVSKPADGSYMGRVAGVPFALQVMLGDNATPASGAAVTITASGGTLGACGGSSCVLTADSTGAVSTTVTPTAAGTVGLTAGAGGGSVATSFQAVVVPPDTLHAVSKPADGSYVGRTAAVRFSVQVALGDTGGAAAGVSVTVSATNATLGSCSGSSCVLTADATGNISTTVSPTAVGTVGLTASAGGGSLSVSFAAAAIPPDSLSVVGKPADGSYTGRTAAVPLSVQVALGDTGGPAAGVAVSVSATNATLNACGASSCVLTADGTGTISTSVTPSAVGAVVLTASAGGGTTSASFNAVAVPPDVLHAVTKPANGSYVNRTAAIPFAVQVALGDTGGPASGMPVSISASNAVLTACGGGSTCTLTADASGTVSTTVTPSSAGSVGLTASAGGGTVTTTFTAVVIPPDTLTVVTKPADGSYVGRTAAPSFAVQTVDGETGSLASGVAVTITATNATLAACAGASHCILTADSTGTIATDVIPLASGAVSLTASAGGGTVSATFNAVPVPPDVLHVVTQPANGSYVGRTAAIPFAVQVALGDTGGSASGVSVSVSATNAVLAACGASTCTITADTTGTISTSVVPSAAGTVGLAASAGGGSVSASFTAVAVPPDSLHVVTKPADGSYAGRTAAIAFSVQVALGDTGGPASGASVTISATNAVLTACGASACTLTADATGTVSTTVTPSAVGTVTLTSSAGGGSVSASFNAVAVPPDTLHVLTQPTNGSYAGAPASIAFSVQALLGDTGAPANGTSVTLTATNATLGCGASTCTLTANSTGSVSTVVTPANPGTVGLSASAGGGTVSTSFSAAAMPPDTLQVVSSPANNAYSGSPAVLPFSVAVVLGDGITPASGVSVALTASGAIFGACGLSTCTVTASSLGTIATTVTATAAGTVTLTASAGGGTVSTTFTVLAVPDTLQVLSVPSDHSVVNQAAATPFTVQARLGVLTNSRGLHALTAIIGAPDAGEIITLTAVGGRLNACGLPSCVLTADSTGTVTTTVTPILPGAVTLLASGGGGSLSSSFAADPAPDILRVASAPANGSYANRVAANPFTVQVMLADGTTPAAGASVTLTATGAMLGSCGGASCIVVADGSGMASSAVTPWTPGTVQLTASAGGGTISASFTSAAVPPDTLHVVSQPANGSYVGRTASAPFAVQVLLGDTGGPAAGVSVTLSSMNGLLGACGQATCILTADASGNVSTSVTPSAAGVVSLNANAGGGTVSASFTAAAVPPDTLHVVSQPANGSYAGRTAAIPFSIQALLGDTGGPASGASVVVSAVNAILNSCGASICTISADTTGTVGTSVTPTTAGTVSLTAAVGGGTFSTTFTAASIPPDSLHVVTQPANGSYAARVAPIVYSVQVLLGDTGGPASAAQVTLSATNATIGACGAATCSITTDSSGTVSTTVMPTAAGLVALTASAGGGTVTSSFTAAAVPPDTLHLVTQPANGSYVARVASLPFAVQTLLGDTGAAAAGAAVTVTASGATLSACGGSSCVLTADLTGTISTSVTPAVVGAIQLTASAGGGTLSVSFNAVAVPPDTLHVVSQPLDGAFVGSPSATRFAVQALLGDTGAPASGASVTLTAANAQLGSCAGLPCVLTADSTGTVSTTVTPVTAGAVMLTAAAGGGTVSASFNAAPDALQIVSQPSGTIYATLPSPTAFAVQVMLADGRTPAAGAAVTLTAKRATLGLCAGASTCVLVADASGIVSTPVTPQQAGTFVLKATAGGGSVSSTLTAVALPPDVVSVVSSPSGAVYVGSVAATRFAVHVLLGDGVTPASSAQVTLSASAATLGACGTSSCVLTADASGDVSTTVTPSAPGVVTLTASTGGGMATATFTVTPDVLRVVTSPAAGTYTGSAAAAPFAVQVLLGDGVTAVAGVAVTVQAANAIFGACALSTCMLTTDSQGMASTPVTATAPGIVALTASSNGQSVSTSFAAVAPPDLLSILSVPASGAYAGRSSATPFTVQVSLGDATNRLPGAYTAHTPASGVAVTLSASGATLDACGQTSCTLTTDASGTVSTTLTPTAIGQVILSAAAGGGTVSSSFTAAAPPDMLRITSVPANQSYVGHVAAAPFIVKTLLGDGVTLAANVSMTLTASGATFGACGQATCVVTASSTGKVSTTVTPTGAGTVILTATAGGGTVSTSFTAVNLPDILRVASVPANGAYTGRFAVTPFSLQVLLGDGTTPASGASVTVTASNATLGACGLASCTVTADAAGMVSTAVMPLLAGSVTLSASTAGGTASASFAAVDPVRTISISRATESVATGTITQWMPVITLLENGLPAQGVAVSWTALPGLALAAQTSMTDASGTATLGVTIGPLASGATPSGTACAWSNVCASFGARALDDSTWRLVVVSGNTQTVHAAGTLQPVVVRAVDDAGDWIAGVTVQVSQVVRGYVACPPTGRCPVAPVLSTSTSTVVTDSDGLVSVTPLQMANTAEATGIVAAAGPNGYLSVTLSKIP